ncbi:hypothetical protein [Gaetbulibacter jejuensis]|uniref:Uncharacterized protein n=1 Tax=Gaetbulibacter jejuensis TaxID=584607 RepID=A0ABN1JZK9_9FLAO
MQDTEKKPRIEILEPILNYIDANQVKFNLDIIKVPVAFRPPTRTLPDIFSIKLENFTNYQVIQRKINIALDAVKVQAQNRKDLYQVIMILKTAQFSDRIGEVPLIKLYKD